MKAVAHVKQHMATSKKTGKVAVVREHDRKMSPVSAIVRGLHKLKRKAIFGAKKVSKVVRRVDDKQIRRNILSAFHVRQKMRVIKFVAKHYGYDKSDPMLKLKADKIFSKLEDTHQGIFNENKIGMSYKAMKDKMYAPVPTREEKQKTFLAKKPTSKQFDSKYHFSYFGRGRVDDKALKSEKVYQGQTFYNQDISGDKNWGETLKREGLRNITVNQVTPQKDIKFTHHTTKDGKLKTSTHQAPLTKFIRILRTGKVG